MAIFEITADQIRKIPETTFSLAGLPFPASQQRSRITEQAIAVATPHRVDGPFDDLAGESHQPLPDEDQDPATQPCHWT